MKILFQEFKPENIPLFLQWAEEPQVKNTWFLPGYPSAEEYSKKHLSSNRTDVFPFLILIDDLPIGYIQYWDIDVYVSTCPTPKVFTNEPKQSYGIDIFIGEPEYLNKGLGSKILISFVKKLHSERGFKRFLIDPSAKNIRAIKCYQKAGFKIIREDFDNVEKIYIMEKIIQDKDLEN